MRPKATRGSKLVNGKTISVRAFKLGSGFDLVVMKSELEDMTDVLLGRELPPIDTGISTLMEVAEAFHSRAKEMEMHLHNAEAEGHVTRGSGAYKFRTGMLRDFIEMTSKTIELGSRRITATQIELQHRG